MTKVSAPWKPARQDQAVEAELLAVMLAGKFRGDDDLNSAFERAAVGVGEIVQLEQDRRRGGGRSGRAHQWVRRRCRSSALAAAILSSRARSNAARNCCASPGGQGAGRHGLRLEESHPNVAAAGFPRLTRLRKNRWRVRNAPRSQKRAEFASEIGSDTRRATRRRGFMACNAREHVGCCRNSGGAGGVENRVAGREKDRLEKFNEFLSLRFTDGCRDC